MRARDCLQKNSYPRELVLWNIREKITTWKEVDHHKGSNPYIYYINRNHVIDASLSEKAVARYANDARGLSQVKGLSNNAAYVEDGLKVYIESKKDIPPGSEILVGYGKEYWDAIRHNQRLERNKARKRNRTGKRSSA